MDNRHDQLPVLDQEILAGLRELSGTGDDDFLGMLLARFCEGYRALRGELAAALDAGDRELAERAAHSIKGSAANVGAARLSAVANDLQELAEEGELVRAKDGLGALDAEAEATLAALEQVHPGCSGA